MDEVGLDEAERQIDEGFVRAVSTSPGLRLLALPGTVDLPDAPDAIGDPMVQGAEPTVQTTCADLLIALVGLVTDVGDPVAR